MLKVFTRDEVQVFTAGKGKGSPPRVRTSSTSSNGGNKKAVPKKDGHGKGAWGKVGSEFLSYDDDSHDPNYVSQAPIVLKETKYILSREDMEDYMKVSLDEYFSNGIKTEVLRPIKEIADPSLNHHIAALVLREACAKENPERELASQLILELVLAKMGFGCSAIENAFDSVLSDLDDISLDTPDADHVLAKFIARAVADEIVAPKYVIAFDIDDKPADDKVRRCMKKAKGLINTTQGLARLEHVWGVSGARSPVRGLQHEISLILKEYITSGSIEETAKCLRDLKAPLYHHEVVYNMVLLGIESGDHKAIQLMVSLLAALGSSGENLISDGQLKVGLNRILADVPDLEIDVPHIKKHLASFYRLAAPCIPDDMRLTNEALYRDIPEDHLEKQADRMETRKRSVSDTAVMPPMQR